MDENATEHEENEPSWRRRRHGRFMRHWMRHAAMVPKGFLRHQLLEKLKEKPMSGSEIMSELEKETKGYWRPSPGSIYPLLSWLQDQGLIKEVEQTTPGIRRYALTDAGETFLQTESKSREEINKHLQNLQGVGGSWYGFGFKGEAARDTGKAAREFFRAVRDLHREVKRQPTKERLEEAKKALEDATKQIQEITRKLQAD
jgi:DNA-binding PadR family transcriptional regulator